MESIFKAIPSILDAIQSELDQLRALKPEVTLCDGEFEGRSGDGYCYRFEIPEGLFLTFVDDLEVQVGRREPCTMDGTFVSVENQYAVIKVPIDFGSLLAELTIRWHPEITYQALSRKLQAMTDNPDNVPLLDLLSSPDKSQNTSELKAEPVFLLETNERQKEAIQKSLSNRITFVWGPPDSGKTKTLAQRNASFFVPVSIHQSMSFFMPSSNVIRSAAGMFKNSPDTDSIPLLTILI